jgi:hypothetical protein
MTNTTERQCRSQHTTLLLWLLLLLLPPPPPLLLLLPLLLPPGNPGITNLVKTREVWQENSPVKVVIEAGPLPASCQ